MRNKSNHERHSEERSDHKVSNGVATKGRKEREVAMTAMTAAIERSLSDYSKKEEREGNR